MLVTLALITGVFCSVGFAKVLDVAAFEERVAKLEQAAEEYEDGDSDPPGSDAFKNCTYSPEVLSALPAALNKSRRAGAVWVVCKLLEPLEKADVEDIRKLMPVLGGLHARYVRYRPFPKIPPGQARQLDLPPEMNRNTSAEDALRALATMSERHEKKFAADLVVHKMNVQAKDLETIIVRLRMKANLPAEDKRNIAAMLKHLNDGYLMYQMILNGVIKEAPNMDEKRAQMFYEALARLYPAAKYMEARFYSYTDINFNPAGTSEPMPVKHLPGSNIAKALNALAPIAKLPTVAPVTTSTVQARKDLESAKKNLTGKTTNPKKAKALLERSIKTGDSDTKKEAQALLSRIK